MKRKIIKIDEEKCNGCGLCIPNCPEGAMQMIDGKARLISDLFCDGLGACIGHCPQGAIEIEEREAEKYNETKVMENIVKQGDNVIIAHLKHLKDHGEKKLLKEAEDFLKKKKIKVSLDEPKKTKEVQCGCPGAKMMDFRDKKEEKCCDDGGVSRQSELRQWPVQIMLVPPSAPYLDNSDLMISADCVPFSYADFHKDFLKNKALLVGCPKLDDIEYYEQKIGQIIESNNLKSITYARMEVPCCGGLTGAIKNAIQKSGKKVPFKEVIIGIDGTKR